MTIYVRKERNAKENGKQILYNQGQQVTPAYAHWLAEVHLAGFAPAFTLSQGDSERSRKPPMPIASVVMRQRKKTALIVLNLTFKKYLKIILMKIYNTLWLLLCISFFVSCNQDNPVIEPLLLPKVKTTEVEYVSQYTATLSGILTSIGESNLVEYGVCVSKNPHPTEEADIKKFDIIESVNIKIPFEFTYFIEGLTGGTTYYVRAFATNMSKGKLSSGIEYYNKIGETVYGNEYKFTTDLETPTVTDADGNIYRTIQIGTQLWMAENLKTTKYNDGTKIPTVKIMYGNEFSKLQTPVYCWYNSDSLTFKNIFGALYNGYAVSTGKLAPTGWHVPTIEDWVVLSNYLGGESVTGGKLKSTNTSDLANHVSFVKEGNWLTPNAGATNSSGFSALPSGNVASYGFGNGGAHGFWWSATESYILLDAYCTIRLSYDKNELKFGEDSNTFGFSVRCVRD